MGGGAWRWRLGRRGAAWRWRHGSAEVAGAADRAVPADATNNLSQLTIEQTASSAKVTGDSGDVLALYSADDSSKATPSSAPVSGPSSSPSQVLFRQRRAVRAARTASSGDSASRAPSRAVAGHATRRRYAGPAPRSSTTRTYELSPDGKQLYVTTKIDNPRFKNPVTFRLVYDPAQSGG